VSVASEPILSPLDREVVFGSVAHAFQPILLADSAFNRKIDLFLVFGNPRRIAHRIR
jgi:hypothetical protein